jgi:selenocysteine lyase/cysteine desulfurase
MNVGRRNVVQWLAGTVAAAAGSRALAAFDGQEAFGGTAATSRPATERYKDEEFWSRVRSAYSMHPQIANLNNAGVSPQPNVVQEAVIANNRFANLLPAVNMWDRLDAGRPAIKAALAVLADCDADEIALNRNSTEGLCTIIFGMPLRRGDEIVLSDWDYDSLRHAWEQRARRDGIELRIARFDPMASAQTIVRAYAEAIGPRTRAVYATHMLHYTGRVLPIPEIVAIAKRRGAITVVDAAQSFAQMPVSFRKFGCDFMAVSLHKWLCAPFGTGMLVVSRARIPDIWPLTAPYEDAPVGIEKFDWSSLGTYSSASEQGISQAITFHRTFGADLLHARLRYLTGYWASRAADIPGFRLHTPIDADTQGALALFSIEGLDPPAIEKRLMDDWQVHVVTRKRKELYGLRVSPHAYTSLAELDRFVAGLRSIVNEQRG